MTELYEVIYREAGSDEYVGIRVLADSLLQAESVVINKLPNLVDLFITDGSSILKYSKELVAS